MRSGRPRRGAIAAYHAIAHRSALVRTRSSEPRSASSGVAVVGALGRANGLSRGAQLQHAAFRAAGTESELVDVDPGPRHFARRRPHRPAGTYVFHAAAPETALLVHGVLPHATAARRIGYWAWELPDPPPDWKRYENLVHEVWTPSTFAADALRSLLRVPVHVVPHRVPVEPRRARPTSDQPFTVLTLADGRSSFARKNPLGAIEAFVRAFGASPDACLVVKLSGGAGDASAIQRAVAARPNVSVITERLDDNRMRELYRGADVLLSLHRAEGFGLPMLEAMAHGVPVVATGWSGNRDFMNADNSLLVPWTLASVSDNGGVYGGVDSRWAEPDVDAAAQSLRDLAQEPELYAAIAAAAHETVASSWQAVPPAVRAVIAPSRPAPTAEPTADAARLGPDSAEQR